MKLATSPSSTGATLSLSLAVTLSMQAVVSAELSRWRGYINSDPERVLAVLRLRDPSLVADELQAPNEWGDTHKVRGRLRLGRSVS